MYIQKPFYQETLTKTNLTILSRSRIIYKSRINYICIKMTEKAIVTKLHLIDNYTFDSEFEVDYLPNIILDETKPEGGGSGPNPTRLLSAAVGHCMSSSLIFCLKKARVRINDLQTKVKTNLYRNDQKKLRIKNIDVEILLEVNKEDKQRVPRCLKLFEDYCTVTKSIRNGIEVNVNVN